MHVNKAQVTRLAPGIVAALLVSVPITPAFALSATNIVSAGSTRFETTVAVAMVFVTAMAFSLQMASGYFVRASETSEMEDERNGT